jgi:hypothetical protein
MRRSLMSLMAGLAVACGGGSETDTSITVGTGITNTGITSATMSESDATTMPGPSFDMFDTDTDSATGTADDGGGDDCGPQELPDTDAVLTGTVFAPNLQLPISGALVYVTAGQVEPVPDGVYCATCVDLGCTTPFTLTNPDGTFTLETISGAGQKLVVQKGQFLRVVNIDVQPGQAAVPPSLSNLPGDWNPGGGKWIPRIAVYDTNPDKVPNVLAKFGMGQVDGSGSLMQGTNRFTLIDDSDEGAFLDDLSEMMKYHIIFLPCASTKYWLGAPSIPAQRLQNLRMYVEAGGKLYATDHSNEYIKDPFPNYQDFYNPGMPDIQPAYDSAGTVVDPDMLAWLQALPPALKDIGNNNPTLNNLPSITTMLNYSGIEAVHEVIVQDDEGNDVNVGPHVWVEGPCQSCSADPGRQRPMAITGQYGCGRMMYSTFENSSSAHAGLNPQELVLLYMILEIGVCFGEPPPPAPPIG